MEQTIHELIPVATLIAIVLSVISFFGSRKKDQSDLDKKQDLEIGVMKEKQNSFEQRVSRLEGSHEVLDSKLAKEVEKVFQKISSVEQTLSHDIKDLGKYIQDINLKK